jgi:hypothetical protein
LLADGHHVYGGCPGLIVLRGCPGPEEAPASFDVPLHLAVRQTASNDEVALLLEKRVDSDD